MCSSRARRQVGTALAWVSSVIGTLGCSEKAPDPPGEAAAAASALADGAASAVPSAWAPRPRSGRSDPTIIDEWNMPSERPGMVRCTARGCGTDVEIHGSLAPEDAEPGKHTFTIVADGRSVTCEVDVTANERAMHEGKCPGGWRVMMGPETRQVQRSMGGMVASVEEAIPGTHTWRALLPVQPVVARVIHRLGKRTILDASTKIPYAPYWPNGPQCEPRCMRGLAELGPKASPSGGPAASGVPIASGAAPAAVAPSAGPPR